MSWQKNYVLAIGAGDKSVQKLANAMAKRYGAGDGNCFSYKVAFQGFPALTEKSLEAVDASTKLMVCGHGHKFGLASAGSDDYGYEARHIAGVLAGAGLKTVGLLSFKACDIGKGDFLEDLLRELKGHAEVGYLIGYKGAAILEKKGKMGGGLPFTKSKVSIQKGSLHVGVPSKRFLKAKEFPDDA